VRVWIELIFLRIDFNESLVSVQGREFLN